MNHKLSTLALALVAVFALGAIGASAAMAEEGTLTSSGPVELSGEDMAGTETTLMAFGGKLTCSNTRYTMGKINQTPHKFITPPTNKITVLRDIKCRLSMGSLDAPATVTSNKCDFERRFLLREGESSKWEMSSDTLCEGENEAIEIHVYSGSGHTTSICTLKITPQKGLKGGAFAENISGGKIKMGGPIKGIHVTRTGLLCGGTAETNEGEEEFNVEVTGKNEAGEATAIEVS